MSSQHYGEIGSDITGGCKKYLKYMVNTRLGDAENIGVPLFISEFGACSGSPACTTEIDYIMKLSDAHSLSWTYYQFKGFHDYSTQYGQNESLGMYKPDGQLDLNKFYKLSRTYATAIQGQTASTFYDEESGTFVFEFICNMDINGQTVVYLNEAEHYPAGYSASVFHSLESNKVS